MEQGRGADSLRLPLQRDTASGLGVFELLDGGEMAIHQDGIGERPQMLCGLEFGRIRRQKEQVDVVGHAQALGAVPAGPIQHQHDLLAVLQAPAWRAKAASSASKSGILTEVAR